MFALAVILPILGGLLMAVQSPTNTELSRHTGNLQATSISFGGGVIVLALAVIITGPANMLMLGEASPWHFLGGFYGSFAVLIITYAVPHLGVALTLTFIMLGQLISGIVVDGLGLFEVEPAVIHPLRIIGCLTVALGILIVYIGKAKQDEKHGINGRALLFAILSFIVGICLSIQAPTNASLAKLVGQIGASFVNFCVGFLLITAIALIAGKGRLQPVRGVGIKAWMCLGGVYGAFGVFSAVFATPYLGVALLMASTMLGQLTGGILIDATGILCTPKIRMNSWRYIGVLILAAGVAMVTFAKLAV